MFFDDEDWLKVPLDPRVEKYMKDNGCNVKEACNELGMNLHEAYDYSYLPNKDDD